jgi:hypothetical protein
MGLSANRDERAERDAAAAKENDEQYPTDPMKIIARRLREFLDATADVNFSARTISLTDGPDGIEFLDKADRQRNWMWQEAVIAGPCVRQTAKRSKSDHVLALARDGSVYTWGRDGQWTARHRAAANGELQDSIGPRGAIRAVSRACA